jgi:hypothetical protein
MSGLLAPNAARGFEHRQPPNVAQLDRRPATATAAHRLWELVNLAAVQDLESVHPDAVVAALD